MNNLTRSISANKQLKKARKKAARLSTRLDTASLSEPRKTASPINIRAGSGYRILFPLSVTITQDGQ